MPQLDFYAGVALCQGPWLILFIAAVGRLARRGSDRVRWFQVVGMTLVIFAAVTLSALYDPNFGVDKYGTGDWAPVVERAEYGLFWIGILLFGTGYFLERGPKARRVPWPLLWRTISLGSAAVFSALGIYAHGRISFPWLESPWSVPRMLFTFGFYPFALGYAFVTVWDLKPLPRPANLE